MSKKWYEEVDAKHWFENNLNIITERLEGRIAKDKEWLELTAYCVAIFEGCQTYEECLEREDEILSCPEESALAVLFVIYHQAGTYEQTQILLVKILHKKLFGHDQISNFYFNAICEIGLDENLFISAVCLMLSKEPVSSTEDSRKRIVEILASPLLSHKALISYLDFIGIKDSYSQCKVYLPENSKSQSKQSLIWKKGEYHE